MQIIAYFIIGFMTASLIGLWYYHIFQKEYTWIDPNLTIEQLQKSLEEMKKYQKKYPYNRSIQYAINAYSKRIIYLKTNN